jgi:hypothetical protein
MSHQGRPRRRTLRRLGYWHIGLMGGCTVKLFRSGLLYLLLVVFLAACGGGGSSSSSPPPLPGPPLDPLPEPIAPGNMEIRLTRTQDDPAKWTLESPESNQACRFPLNANGDRCISAEGVHCGFKENDFQFKFTITQQD